MTERPPSNRRAFLLSALNFALASYVAHVGPFTCLTKTFIARPMRAPVVLVVTAITLAFASAGAMLVPAFIIALAAILLADRRERQIEKALADYKQAAAQGREQQAAPIPPTTDRRLLRLLGQPFSLKDERRPR